MNKQALTIEAIPALLWGEPSDSVWITVHGDQSSKEDTVIRLFAGIAAGQGAQVLSFDLPEHGDRKDDPRRCDARNCVADLRQILQYARRQYQQISVFGCSIGAYFSLLAYRDAPIRQALFLSPVVDMQRIIQNMMHWFNVSTERLEQEKEISTPVKTLSWDYYQYVLQHPVVWAHPTAILYGAKDSLCEIDYVRRFAEQTGAKLTILEDGEHFFHTEPQLCFFEQWLRDTIKP